MQRRDRCPDSHDLFVWGASEHSVPCRFDIGAIGRRVSPLLLDRITCFGGEATDGTNRKGVAGCFQAFILRPAHAFAIASSFGVVCVVSLLALFPDLRVPIACIIGQSPWQMLSFCLRCLCVACSLTRSAEQSAEQALVESRRAASAYVLPNRLRIRHGRSRTV